MLERYCCCCCCHVHCLTLDHYHYKNDYLDDDDDSVDNKQKKIKCHSSFRRRERTGRKEKQNYGMFNNTYLANYLHLSLLFWPLKIKKKQ